MTLDIATAGVAFVKRTRFGCMGLVLDLSDPELAVRLVKLGVLNPDALKALRLARSTKARYLVVAGQLHRKKAGAYAVILPHDDVDALCLAVRSAFERLTEIGESDSQWIVFGDAIREPVMSALAEVSATEGSA